MSLTTTENNTQHPAKPNWLLIANVYLLAFGISSVFNSGVFSEKYKSFSDTYFINNWTFLPAGIGTLVAALLAFYFDKKRIKTITLFGNNTFKNIAIAITPLVVFTSLAATQQSPAYCFALAAIALIYALCEEIFWRGYLQDALSGLDKNKSYLLIGVMWWAWHFRFTTTFDYTGFVAVCVISTFLLGTFTEGTKSYLTSAGLHSMIILLSSTGELNNAKITAAILTVVIWVTIGKFWKNKVAEAPASVKQS